MLQSDFWKEDTAEIAHRSNTPVTTGRTSQEWRLGLETETDNLLRVLALNYPDHENFDENGNLILENEVKNRNRSWTNIITLGLLDRPEIPPPTNINRSS